MADERLKYHIEAIWTGKGATAQAKADIASVGKTAKTSTTNQDALAKSSLGVGAAFKSLAAGGAVLAAGAAVVSFGKESIAAASNVEEAASKFKFVFGPAAESTAAALDEFAAAAGRSRYELQETAAGFGGFLEGMVGSKEQAAEMSIQLAKLTTDLSSFYNVSEGDAAAALSSGLLGQSEPLLKFGVILTAANVEAEVFRSGMAKTKDEITEAMKAQARMNLILEGTVTAQGDAARTSDSYANTQRAMEAAVLDLKVAIGQGLLPVMVDLTKIAGEAAKGVGAFVNVQQQGGAVIDGIIDTNIAQAESMDDLVSQYQKLTKSAGMWGGLAAALTGTQDDLYNNMQKVKDEILRTSDSSEEYIAALTQIGVVGDEMGQTTAAQAEAMYEAQKAELLLADAIANRVIETTSADTVMLGHIGTVETAVIATDAYGFSLDLVNDSTERGIALYAAAEPALLLMETGQRLAALAAGDHGTLLERINAEIDILERQPTRFPLDFEVRGLEALQQARDLLESIRNTGSFSGGQNDNDQPDPYSGTGDRPPDPYAGQTGDVGPRPPAPPRQPAPPPGATPSTANVTTINNYNYTQEAAALAMAQAERIRRQRLDVQ